ncbi:MAG: dicarboxylate/amino acid:cation symporter [Muribaculaceae bacterium]|nr:dicarboxylate/amino acid:cation symporter [Muribaculaceae bacterium]
MKTDGEKITTDPYARPNIRSSFDRRQFIIWIAALVIGAGLGLTGIKAINGVANVIATIYTRLFQLLAVPTIALAIVTTLASAGKDRSTGKLFIRTVTYTFLTTLAAAVVGLLCFIVIKPENLPAELLSGGSDAIPEGLKNFTLGEHFMSVIPDNIVKPLLEGNVLSILILAFAAGIGLSVMPDSDGKNILTKGLNALQELLLILIRALIWTLPLGILAFSEQLTAQMSGGMMMDSLGRYILVVLLGNCLQFAVVLPLFLLARGLNPLKVLKAMGPAVLMALFTKSSAATLPVTMQNAEERLGVSPRISRFVLPLCTTINMNGCAAFILVTSLFVMQNGGMNIGAGTMITWLALAVISAIGNAGVPMGCYFLTLSLMTGIGAPVVVMGLILPIYTVIDMVETAENVWSDSCVCAMTGHDLEKREVAQ